MEHKKKNPYKGLYSYEENDSHVFYGRNAEKRNLFRLVKHNFLSVVFGKSGIGKTSLINAGLFPKARENGFLPIRLRLDFSPSAPGLIQQVRETIRKEIQTHHIHISKMHGEEEAEPFDPGETLWEYFHRVRHFDGMAGKEVTPVLVFDQFEEMFTLGKNHRDSGAFLDGLCCLLENQLPDAVKARLLEEEGEEGESAFADTYYTYSDARPNVRVVVSLREDYLPHLDSLKAQIPSIGRVTFRVLHLNGKQGREIIGMPGGIDDENVIKGILQMFYPEGMEEGEEIPDEQLEIEPSILSLLCFQLLEKEKGDAVLMTRQARDEILADFYNSVMETFPAEVETFVESKLLTEGGFRTPFYLERDHPLRDAVERLQDRRVLRKVHYGGKEHIEIIHDVLVPIIREKRNKRLEEKRKKELQEELRRRNKRIINRVVITAGIVSILLAVFALIQWNRAAEQYRAARLHNLVAETTLEIGKDNVKAIRIAEALYRENLPQPPPRVLQVLSAAAASSLEHRFYNVNMRHKDEITIAVFSPKGEQILTASKDKTAKLWDLQGNLLADLDKHEAPVTSALFSPDGKQVLTVSAETARLWDWQGTLPADLYKHEAPITSALFSPDGTQILTASADKTAKLWDLKQKNVETTFDGHIGSVAFALFSPDGKHIVTASETIAKLWDLEGEHLADLAGHTDRITSAVFTADGTRILTVSNDNTVKVWDLKGTLLADLAEHTDRVTSAVFSPEGDRVLTASWDHSAHLWDWKRKRFIPLAAHTESVDVAVFSPDGTRILTASRDKTAKLWDLQGTLLVNLTGHTSIGIHAQFFADGKQIMTASEDGPGRVWDLQGNLLAYFKNPGGLSAAALSPDSTKVLTVSYDGTAKLWTLQDNLFIDLNEHKGRVQSAVFSPDGQKILTASWDSTARLWDLNGNLLETFSGHKKRVNNAIFSQKGDRVLTASYDNTAKLWDLKGTCLVTFKGHKDLVTFAFFSPDGKQVLTASKDETAKLWDLKGNCVVTFDKKHTDWVRMARFSPDGTRVLTASKDKTARLWNLQGELLHTFEGHTDMVYDAIFSPDGKQVLTISWDRTARLWDVQGTLMTTLKHNHYVYHAVFSPDGTRILTASADRTPRLWDLQGTLLMEFSKHTDQVRTALFSPDGRRIVTASRDQTVKLWDLRGNVLSDFRHRDFVWEARFSPDGTRILTASWDGTAKLLYTPEAIYKWLKTANIPQLSKEEKERLKLK